LGKNEKTLTKTAGNALLELEQFVIHASVYWEFHWTLISRESFSRYKGVFNDQVFWYNASKESSLVAAVAAISKFVEKNPETINIHYLIQLLSSSKEDWNKEISEMQRFLGLCSDTSKDITILRSNYYIHKNRNLSFSATYNKTKSTYDHVRELIEYMRCCLSVVSLAASGQEIITDAPSQKTVQELTAILERLKK